MHAQTPPEGDSPIAGRPPFFLVPVRTIFRRALVRRSR